MFSKTRYCKAIALKLFSLKHRMLHSNIGAVDNQCDIDVYASISEKEGPLRRLKFLQDLYRERVSERKPPKISLGLMTKPTFPFKPKKVVNKASTIPLKPKKALMDTSMQRAPKTVTSERHTHRRHEISPRSWPKVGTGMADREVTPTPNRSTAKLFPKCDSIPLRQQPSDFAQMPHSKFNVQESLLPLTKEMKHSIAFQAKPAAIEKEEDIVIRLHERQKSKFSAKPENQTKIRNVSIKWKEANIPSEVDPLPIANVNPKNQIKQKVSEGNKISATQMMAAPLWSLYTVKKLEVSQKVEAQTKVSKNAKSKVQVSPAKNQPKVQTHATQKVIVKPYALSYPASESEKKQMKINQQLEILNKNLKINQCNPKSTQPKVLDSLSSISLWHDVLRLEKQKSKKVEPKFQARGSKQAHVHYTECKAKTPRPVSCTTHAKPQQRRIPVPYFADRIRKTDVGANTAKQFQHQRTPSHLSPETSTKSKDEDKRESKKISNDTLPKNSVPLNRAPMNQLPTKSLYDKPIAITKTPTKQMALKPYPKALTPTIKPKSTKSFPKISISKHQTDQSNFVKPIARQALPKSTGAANEIQTKKSNPLERTKASPNSSGNKASNSQTSIVARSVKSVVDRCIPKTLTAREMIQSKENSTRNVQFEATDSITSSAESLQPPEAIIALARRQPPESPVSQICRAAKTFQNPARKKF